MTVERLRLGAHGFQREIIRSVDEPSTTVAATGLGSYGYDIVIDRPSMPDASKPPYRVPSMAEVAALRGTNGLTVVSTFSGCGGSCLGFEMAGYRVLWANDIGENARESYQANHSGGVNSVNSYHYQVEPEADISGYAIGAEWDRLKPGGQSEKYFNLVRADPTLPSPTLTATGGVNSGYASVTHPTERRKFTIAELRRVCAFPDDFLLPGSYAEQWARLGNSVPPIMMRAIAETIAREVFGR